MPNPNRKQCKHCPWKVTTNPHDIPNGYSAKKHRALSDTIAQPALVTPGHTLKMMACHETGVGKELPCAGWLAHQLGPGNNIGLRLAVIHGHVSTAFTLDGEQHPSFEDTLPKRTPRRRAPKVMSHDSPKKDAERR